MRCKGEKGQAVAIVAKGEQGQAVAMVALIVAAITALIVVVTMVTLHVINQGAVVVSQESAFAAAQSGITDYVGTIRSNPTFPLENARTSAYAAFGGSSGTSTWEPVPGSETECFWFRTDSVDPNPVITVTGRDGPSSANCAYRAGARYRYQTVGAILADQTFVSITVPDPDDLPASDGDSDDAAASFPNGDQVVQTWLELTQCPTGTVDSAGQEVTAAACT